MVTPQVSSVGVTCDYRFLLYFLLKYDKGTITRDKSGRVCSQAISNGCDSFYSFIKINLMVEGERFDYF